MRTRGFYDVYYAANLFIYARCSKLRNIMLLIRERSLYDLKRILEDSFCEGPLYVYFQRRSGVYSGFFLIPFHAARIAVVSVLMSPKSACTLFAMTQLMNYQRLVLGIYDQLYHENSSRSFQRNCISLSLPRNFDCCDARKNENKMAFHEIQISMFSISTVLFPHLTSHSRFADFPGNLLD